MNDPLFFIIPLMYILFCWAQWSYVPFARVKCSCNELSLAFFTVVLESAALQYSWRKQIESCYLSQADCALISLQTPWDLDWVTVRSYQLFDTGPSTTPIESHTKWSQHYLTKAAVTKSSSWYFLYITQHEDMKR